MPLCVAGTARYGLPAPYLGRQALQPAPYPRAVVAIDVPELALEIGFLAGDHTVADDKRKRRQRYQQPVVGRLVGTFEPARVMVKIAHANSASARTNTIAPSRPGETAADKNGKGMSQLSTSPASTASAHAIGGRTMTFAVSAVSAMAGPVKLRSPLMWPAEDYLQA